MTDREPDGATAVDAWTRHRRRMTDIAYRMLGSFADAEDITQEVYLRLQRQALSEIDDVEGWLVTVTTRLCLDRLRSARTTRRRYVGPWLPEPLVSLPGLDPDPADRITLDDSVRLALLVVLERLSPAERTAFVLHDVFGVPFDQIAVIVGRSAPACRQLASRARRHVRGERRFDAAREDLDVIVEEFRHACEAGDLEALVATLDPDVTGEFDSGGAIPGAPRVPVTGARRIAALLLGSFEGHPVRFLRAEVNGQPGVAVLLDGRVVTIISVQADVHGIHHVHAVGSPTKLAHLNVGVGQ